MIGPNDLSGRPIPDPDLPDPGIYENRKGPNDPMNPVSPKAYTGMAGSAAGIVLSTFLLWLIGAGLFHGGWSADQVDNAMAAVPAPLAYLILFLVGCTLTGLGVYLKADPERLPTLGAEQRRRVGLQGVDVRPRRADLSQNGPTGGVIR